MKAMTNLFFGVMAFGLAGCGCPTTEPLAPLTGTDWKGLPVEQKYTPEALERLKQGDPTLETPEGWDKFRRTTLAAARKKDFAGRKRQ